MQAETSVHAELLLNTKAAPEQVHARKVYSVFGVQRYMFDRDVYRRSRLFRKFLGVEVC